MREKGQALIVVIGVFCVVILVFFVGWWVGKHYSSPHAFEDNYEIEVAEKADLKDGNVHVSVIQVDNCQSIVESKITETRGFSYQQLFWVDYGDEVGASFMDAVTAKLQKKYNIQNGRVETVTRTFEFTSPPKMKSIYTIEWTEKLQTGNIEYNDYTYSYSFPIDIEIATYSKQEPCP